MVHSQQQQQLSVVPPPPPPMPDEDIAHMVLKAPTCMDEIESSDWFELDFKGGWSADIYCLDWSKAIGFKASEGGAEGILFIQFEDKSIVTVKASSTVAADILAYDLASRSGISAPLARIVRFGLDPELDIIKSKINELDEKNHPLQRGHQSKMMERAVFSIMEYIPGKGLLDIQAKEIFGKGKLVAKGMNMCREIANVTVFDIVLNNWDRIPLIWDNEGNPENIIVWKRKNSAGQLEFRPVAIDNTITCIDPSLEENFSEYMDKVRFLINELCSRCNRPNIFENVRQEFLITGKRLPSVEHIREFFMNVLSYDIGDDGMIWVTIGLLEQMQEFANLTRSTFESMRQAVADNLSPVLDIVTTNLDGVGFNKINVDFLDAVSQIFHEALPVIQEMLFDARKVAAATVNLG